MARDIFLTGVERTFGEDEIIVSKTDLTGKITYANRVFLRVAGYTEREVLGQPHSMIRHPEMPRCVFKLLWDTIKDGREIFAYVVNRAKEGDHYWVFAHVTPTFANDGAIIGFHSNRRTPDRKAVKEIEKIYALLNEEERKFSRKEDAIRASTELLVGFLGKNHVPYDEFVFSL
jgi:PAS domain S-box-containing protein